MVSWQHEVSNIQDNILLALSEIINMPKLKTVKHWEKEYDIKLEWDVKPSGNAENIRCLTCKDNDGRLQGLKNYNCSWIDSSKNATSDSVRKHVNTDMHRRAVDIEMQKHLGSQKYAENVMKTTPIGKSLTKWRSAQKKC